MKQQTLLFLIDPEESRVLLAMKKRGFGVGKWNGVGGKVEQGEAVGDAVLRETLEEICVHVDASHLNAVATLEFSFRGSPNDTIRVHVFTTTTWTGEPTESEEMKPEWFSMSSLPFSSMWVDDPYWLPQVLAGKKVTASFSFNEDGKEILEMDVHENN